jgi:hypothetical protein
MTATTGGDGRAGRASSEVMERAAWGCRGAVAAVAALTGIAAPAGTGGRAGAVAVAGAFGFAVEAGRAAGCWARAQTKAQASASRERAARPVS